jgi:hypothetical protein
MIVERNGDASSDTTAIGTVLRGHFSSRNLATVYVTKRIDQAAQFIHEFGFSDPLKSVDLLYLLSRNRFHFGLAGRVRSRLYTSINTLNSPLAVAASYCITGIERARGKAGYDLMRFLDPELAEMPFAGNAWHPSIRRLSLLRRFRTPKLGLDRPPLQLDVPKVKQGLSDREVASRDMFRSLIESAHPSLSALLDMNQVRRIVAHESAAARMGRRLSGALTWYQRAIVQTAFAIAPRNIS